MDAKQDEAEEFVEAWTEFARWVSTMPGAGTARLTRDLSESRRYLSFAPWGERRGDERVEERPRVRGANGPSTRRRQRSNTKVSRNGVRAEISALSR